MSSGIAIPGGGGGAPAVPAGWSPNAVPTVPHAQSDEFDGAALDAKWTLFDQTAALTVSVADSHLKLERATEAGVLLAGVHQPVPVVSDWMVWTKITLLSPLPASTSMFGALFLAEDLDANPTTANWLLYGLDTNLDRLASITRTAYNSSGSYVNTRGAGDRTSIGLRFRVSGSTVDVDYSWNGSGWVEADANITTGLSSINKFGVAFNNRSGFTAPMYVDYVRVAETSSIFDQVNGGPL